MIRRAVLLMGVALFPAPALAQYIGGAPPPLPAAPRPGEIQTPAGALARAVRTLAQSPRDFNALIMAGRAAVDLGDTQAAIGFFGRAEEVRPSDPAPKIGMGAATVATGDANGAMRWFYQAQQLGATGATVGADRGLAQDLLGNQAAAQVDYRAALGGREANDARRRLALSLGISGDRTGAFATLQPLLMRGDPGAQRIRAFVLALVGDERGASSAIDSAMPGTGSRMAGFFRLLPTLSAPQKAAAVHLGVFPDPSQIRVAAVSPRILSAPVATARAVRAAPPPRRPAREREPRPERITRGVRIAPPVQSPLTVADRAPPVILQPSPPVAEPSPPPRIIEPLTPVTTAPQPGFSPATAAPVAIATTEPAPREPLAVAVPEQPVVALSPVVAETPPVASSEPATAIVALSGDRLSGIDRLLAQADLLPVPPAPQPRYEAPTEVAAINTAKADKAAEAKKAADRKKVADARMLADAKKLAEAKKLADSKKAEAKKAAEEKAASAALGLAGTNWVQLAGGSNADRMGVELKRLAAKSAALKRRGGAVTAGKDYFRLLTGPFATRGEAQAFVNQLAKDGVDGFSWTRTPAAIKIEKLSPK